LIGASPAKAASRTEQDGGRHKIGVLETVVCNAIDPDVRKLACHTVKSPIILCTIEELRSSATRYGFHASNSNLVGHKLLTVPCDRISCANYSHVPWFENDVKPKDQAQGKVANRRTSKIFHSKLMIERRGFWNSTTHHHRLKCKQMQANARD
jgi:hypothetical protein